MHRVSFGIELWVEVGGCSLLTYLSGMVKRSGRCGIPWDAIGIAVDDSITRFVGLKDKSKKILSL